jgi:hypothetical protein
MKYYVNVLEILVQENKIPEQLEVLKQFYIVSQVQWVWYFVISGTATSVTGVSIHAKHILTMSTTVIWGSNALEPLLTCSIPSVIRIFIFAWICAFGSVLVTSLDPFPHSERLFSLTLHPDQLWGPPSLLSNEYWGLFPQGNKQLGHEADRSLLSTAEVKEWVEL